MPRHDTRRHELPTLVPRFLRVFLLLFPVSLAAATVHHQLDVALEPEEHSLRVTDRISWTEEITGDRLKLVFDLHAGLKPRVLAPPASLSLVRRLNGPVPIERYRLKLPAGYRHFTLAYGGRIHHALSTAAEGRGRVQRHTPGLISPEGVYLNGNSYWFPRFGNAPISFTMKVDLPEAWASVSQGSPGTAANGRSEDLNTWKEIHPQDDIYLLANRFHVYRQRTPNAQALVYLRQPDPELSNKYLGATAHYLDLYSRLLGPYPYGKFALVENFWETGYGMPSFTLLGPRVIRLPFILHSSYPHEILHNWWGNGVYVDYPSGNWSEGLTAYLADHLVQEERGRGANYRRSALQKYADYVAETGDFPLTEFRSRHGEVSQAVGYNKTLMFFHMLRQRLGDKTFLEGLRHFYADNRFRPAAYTDLLAAFEAVSGEPLEDMFRQWTERVGAPSLSVRDVRVSKSQDQFRLQGTLHQVQGAPYYALAVPLVIQLEATPEVREVTLEMQAHELAFELMLPSRPVRLMVDPRFDLFRRLDRGEIPASLGQLFGAEKLLFVLPASAPKPMREAYGRMASRWGASEEDMVWDHELTKLPLDRSLWILGWENRHRPAVAAQLNTQGANLSELEVRLPDRTLSGQSHTVVLTMSHPDTSQHAMGWLGAHDLAAVPGLVRKLPHYGKYSYLAFSGSAPTNVLKGQWTVQNSPLAIRLTAEQIPPLRVPLRPPLTAAIAGDES